MKKKLIAWIGAVTLGMGVLAGCGSGSGDTAPAAASTAAAEAVTEAAAEAVTEAAAGEAAEAATEAASEAATEEADEPQGAALTDLDPASIPDDDTEVRVGSLQGPTTMGLVNLMKLSEEGKAEGNYSFTMSSQPDEIVAAIAGGKLDIALVPANLASVLYNKTKGGVSVIDINTLGVLYCVTGDDSVKSVKDLAGKTVLTTGQGATPEYALNYLLDAEGVTDAKLEFKSEATEIAAALQADPTAVAVLPQPFATIAQLQNDKIHEAFSLTDAWDEVSGGKSRFLTGVTIVTNSFLKEHEGDVVRFVIEQNKSVKAANSDAKTTAQLCAEYGIVAKPEPVVKAIPKCNIVCIGNDEMKSALSGYLDTLAAQNPKSVGGSVPGDDFYYMVNSYTGK